MDLMKPGRNNIVLTGGHAATPGIAIVEEIRKRFKGNEPEIYWIGSKSAIEGSKLNTLEYRIYPKIGVNFYPIVAGKLQTKFTKHTISSILKIPIGFVQALVAIIKTKPKVVLSFGGYTSFPVVFWAWFFRIPVILHEQTVTAGRAALASAIFATKIALSRKESQQYFSKEKSILVGNPVMTEITKIEPKREPGSPPTILIMGGSRGSQFINEEIIKIVPELTKKYRLIHITGEAEYEKFKQISGKSYEIIPSVNPLEMAEYYKRADLIISRSGANSVSEMIITKRPAILIPLPRTHRDEQVKNALYAQRFGIAKVMNEKEVNPKSLEEAIEELFKRWSKIEALVRNKVSPDINASKKLADIVLAYV